MSDQTLPIDLQKLAPVFLEALAVPILACDSQEQIVYSNAAAEKQLNARSW